MKIKQFVLAVSAALTTAGALVVLPSSASAHHPVVSGQAVCLDAGEWQVTWTVTADEARGLDWQLTGPAGWETGLQPDDESFTKILAYPAAQTSAEVTVSAEWSNGVVGTASGGTSRPEDCGATTTTTTIVEEPTTTTTTIVEEPTTTTTIVEEPTTTTTIVGGPTTTTTELSTTTTDVSSGGPTTTTQPPTAISGPSTTSPTGISGPSTSAPGQLPATGTGTDIAVVALLVLLAGVAMFLGGRRASS